MPVDGAGYTFDLRRLFAAIDAQRQDQAWSWAALSREVGVSVSTIRRYQDADDAEADGVLALVRWLGSAPEDYIDGAHNGDRLGDEGFVRVDTRRIAAAVDNPAIAKRSRLTIQGLTAAALQAGVSVASLTRQSWS